MPKEELFIALGVKAPKGLAALSGLDAPLPKILEWASKRDMDVVDINDFGGQAVTDERVRDALPRDVLVGRERIVVYFCGHGFFVNGEAGWVLSGGPTNWMSVIGVLKFRDMLGSYGVPNMAIWSDACLSLRYNPGGTSPILNVGPQPNNVPKTDLFFATREGTQAFVVRDGDVWKPLFSQVVVDALTSEPPIVQAIAPDVRFRGEYIVSSQSLGDLSTWKCPGERVS